MERRYARRSDSSNVRLMPTVVPKPRASPTRITVKHTGTNRPSQRRSGTKTSANAAIWRRRPMSSNPSKCEVEIHEQANCSSEPSNGPQECASGLAPLLGTEGIPGMEHEIQDGFA